MSLTLAEARTIIENAAAKANEIGAKCAIAVVDPGGHVISIDVLDGANLYKDKMAKGKALAALVLGQNTHEALDMHQTKPTRYFGLLSLFSGELYFSGGGVLIETEGEIVGAIGIAGGKMGADEVMASAGIAAWRAEFNKPE